MSEEINKLEELILNEKDPYKKVDFLNQLSGKYLYIDKKKVIEKAKEAYNISKSIYYENGIAQSRINMANGYFYLSKYQNAIINYNDALVYFEKQENLDKVSEINNGLGKVYGTLGIYNRAVSFFNNALEVFIKTGNLDGQASALNNIGVIFGKMEKHKNALQYYKRAYDITKKYLGIDGCPIILLNIGIVLNRLEKYEEAFEILKNSLRLSQEKEYWFTICNCYNELGINYINKNEYEEALKYYKKSLEIARKNEYKNIEINNLVNIGDLFFEKGEDEKALECYEDSLKKAEKLDLKETIYNVYYKLSQYYKKHKKYEEALICFENFHKVKNEVINKSSESRMQSLMIEHNVEQLKNKAMIYHLQNVELKKKSEELEEKNHILEQLSNVDELTGVYNRRYIYDKLNQLCHKPREENIDVLIMIDIDDFKFINDTYGHTVGDKIIKKVSECIVDTAGQKSVVGRYGGDEFIIILEDTDIKEAKLFVQKLLAIIKNTTFLNGLKITLSGGMAVFDKTEQIDEVLANADRLLYKVKRSGKNNIISMFD